MAVPLKMSHLFGGIVGGVVFGLASGLLLGSCVFEGGPNRHSVGAGPAPAEEAQMGRGRGNQAPGGMDPGSGVMESVFAKVSELKQDLERNPQNRSGLVELANLFYDAGKFEDAIPYYERALAIDRRDPNILTDMANCYWISGNLDKARDLLRETQASFPNHWQSAANLFFLALKQGDAKLAGEALSRVRTLNPGFEKLPEMDKLFGELRKSGA